MMKKDFNMDRTYLEKQKEKIKKVYENFENYVFENENSYAIIALSGGPDSIYLAEMLYNYLQKERGILKEDIPKYVLAVHINHMIRKEAKEDEKLAEEFCKSRNIPFVVYTENMERNAELAKESVETYSRNYRYNALLEESKKYLEVKSDISKISENEEENGNEKEISEEKVSILTAHTYDDNAETIFLRLMRGTSKKGLIGISKNTKLDNNIYLVRPILDIKKEELLDYLENYNISYAIDKTNFETEYTRNKVRNILFKEIEGYGFDIVRSLNNLSENILEEEKYLEHVIESTIKDSKITIANCKENDDITSVRYNNGVVIYDINRLMKFDKYIVKRVIVRTIEEMRYDSNNVSSVNIEDIYNLIENNINGKKIMPNKNIVVTIERKSDYVESKKITKSEKVVVFKRVSDNIIY